MKLKVSLHRPGGAPATDIVVEADADAHVGDVAQAIARADPARATPSRDSLTLRIVDAAGERVVAPGLTLARAGVQSGASVALVDGAGRFDDSAGGSPVAAILVVESGPDAGKQFPLRPGSNFVGRGSGNDVVINDKLISKNHARIDITDVVSVVDRGSVNGVVVRDQQVPSAVLQSDDRVLLGDSRVRIVPQALGSAVVGAAVEFNRSPRLDPLYEGLSVEAPEPPAPPAVNPLPVVALIAPILFGGVMYAVTQNPTTVLFVALSPLMMIGNVIEQRLTGKRNYKRAVANFRDRLRELDAMLDSNRPVEIEARRHEHPSAREVFDAARALDPLLWTRRPIATAS